MTQKKKQSKEHYDLATKEKCIRMVLEDGMRSRDVQRKTGVPSRTIRRWVAEVGAKMADLHEHFLDDVVDEVIALAHRNFETLQVQIALLGDLKFLTNEAAQIDAVTTSAVQLSDRTYRLLEFIERAVERAKDRSPDVGDFEQGRN